MREIRPRRRGRSLGSVKDGGGHHDDEYAQHDRWKSYEQMAPAQRLHVFESVSREHMRHRESSAAVVQTGLAYTDGYRWVQAFGLLSVWYESLSRVAVAL